MAGGGLWMSAVDRAFVSHFPIINLVAVSPRIEAAGTPTTDRSPLMLESEIRCGQSAQFQFIVIRLRKERLQITAKDPFTATCGVAEGTSLRQSSTRRVQIGVLCST